jgi:hypothetical protein
MGFDLVLWFGRGTTAAHDVEAYMEVWKSPQLLVVLDSAQLMVGSSFMTIISTGIQIVIHGYISAARIQI